MDSQWLIERLPQIGSAAAGIAALLGLMVKTRMPERIERFARWVYGEIRTLIFLRMELAECRRERTIREGSFTTAEATNQELLTRVRLLVELCGESVSNRPDMLPPQAIPSHDGLTPSAPTTETQPN